MKMFIVLAAVMAVALAAPQGGPQAQSQQVVLVKETPLDNLGLGDYHYGYELSDGHAREEQGTLRNAGSENEALVVSGSFTWVDPATNQRYTVTYTADENGFHPQGEHIPSV